MEMRKIDFSPVFMGESEIEIVLKTILSGWITTGPVTKEFEKEVAAYCETRRVACLSSATSAMEIALRLLGVGPGDEVIVPAYTYTATASITQHVGAKLVMIDSRKDDWEMDYDRLEDAITCRTKVIIPVDLGGILCDYDRIMSIVRRKSSLFRPGNILQEKIGRVVVLADSAHTFGGVRNGKRSGVFADFTTFSFHAVKNLTTAEGGALTWKLPFGDEIADWKHSGNPGEWFSTVPVIEGETWNDLLYRLSMLMSLHGQNKDALAKNALGSWDYDILGPWYKCNMTDVLASLGLSQLRRFESILARRRELARIYCDGLKGLDVRIPNHFGSGYCSPEEALAAAGQSASVSSHHLFLVRLAGRNREQANRVMERMAERGVATNVHYKPLPMMTAYKALGFDIADYPNAYALFENEISLPLHTCLSDEDAEYVISNFREMIQG